MRQDYTPTVLRHRTVREDAHTNALQRHPGAAREGPLKPHMFAGPTLPELLAYEPILPVVGFCVPRVPSLYPGCASNTEEAKC